MNHNLPQDELLQRYAQAKAAQPDGLPDQPSAALRERIMQAAREQANAMNTVAHGAYSMPAIGSKSLENKAEAANDSIWNVKFVASLAVMGLSGLLWWQFEHGTPEEQQAAQSAQPSPAVIATAPAPAPSAAPIPAKEMTSLPTASKAKNATELPSARRPKLSDSARTASAQIPASDATPSASVTNTESAVSEAPRATYQASAPQSSTPPMPAPAARSAAVSKPAHAPLGVAAHPSQIFTAIQTKDSVALRRALDVGLSPQARNADSNTALIEAVRQRWPEGVRILLDAGADRSAKNTNNQTASDVAIELGYEDMDRLLNAPR